MHPHHMERLANDRQVEMRGLAATRKSTPSDGPSPRRAGRPALVRGTGTLLVRLGQRLAGPDALATPPRLDLAHLRGQRH
jgi:hypothetical protein